MYVVVVLAKLLYSAIRIFLRENPSSRFLLFRVIIVYGRGHFIVIKYQLSETTNLQVSHSPNIQPKLNIYLNKNSNLLKVHFTGHFSSKNCIDEITGGAVLIIKICTILT